MENTSVSQNAPLYTSPDNTRVKIESAQISPLSRQGTGGPNLPFDYHTTARFGEYHPRHLV
jgi:hypothetical protein